MTTATTESFGESEYGERMEYTKPKYRDPVFFALYYIHVAVVTIAAIYIWAVSIPAEQESSSSSSSMDSSVGGIFVAVFGCAVVGVLFGLFWLQVMKKYAGCIIKAMLILNIAVWILVALIGFITGAVVLIVIGILLAVIYGLYTWCVWRRIPFASVLLSIGSTIITKYGGTIFISLAVIVFNIIWVIIWMSCAWGYVIAATYTETDGTEHSPSNIMIFLLLVSLYWGFQVNKNVSHTTTCGVAATWYFTKEITCKPTPAAFKRTMTTSFGSVALGSLIVAVLQALRAMLRNGKRGALACIVACILMCIERLVRYFNKYAYAQCAIYGTSFVQSAKATWQLFMTRGIEAIINDDLSGMAITCGAIFGGVVAGAFGYFMGTAFYGTDSDGVTVSIVLAIYGFFIGMVLCSCVLMVLASSVVALFVCYAEDPAALYENHSEDYQRLSDAKPDFGAIYNSFGSGRGGGGQHAAPAQTGPQQVYVQQPQQQQQQQQVVYVQQPPQQQQQVMYAQQPQQPQQQVVYVQQPPPNYQQPPPNQEIR